MENYFLMPFSLWNCAFLTIFDFEALYFWNQSILLNETFRSASPLRFPENEAILDGHGNCLMPATPIFQKHCFFKKCPKNLTYFGKLKIFFRISCCNFIGKIRSLHCHSGAKCMIFVRWTYVKYITKPYPWHFRFKDF